MLTADCQTCGYPVPILASACRRCGAPNATRLSALAVAGSLLLLVAAIAIAAIVAIRWVPLEPGDFTWLTKAMTECDGEAEEEPATVHFLVVPMASAPAEDERWKAKSLNDIGNAILLTQRDTIGGLEDGTLRISTEQYEFSVRDEATGGVYNLSPSVGVKKFLVPDGDQIKEFKVQFRTGQTANEAAWGAAFQHRQGTCYWVNAIIGH